jgi:hypothetical protein
MPAYSLSSSSDSRGTRPAPLIEEVRSPVHGIMSPVRQPRNTGSASRQEPVAVCVYSGTVKA